MERALGARGNRICHRLLQPQCVLRRTFASFYTSKSISEYSFLILYNRFNATMRLRKVAEACVSAVVASRLFHRSSFYWNHFPFRIVSLMTASLSATDATEQSFQTMRIFEQSGKEGINFPAIQATTEDAKVTIDLLTCNGYESEQEILYYPKGIQCSMSSCERCDRLSFLFCACLSFHVSDFFDFIIALSSCSFV